MKHFITSAVTAALALSGASSTLAQNAIGTKDSVGKIGNLLTAASAPTQLAPSAGPTSQFSVARIPTINGKLPIDAVAKGSPAQLLRDLEALGLENGSVYGQVVSGLMPATRLGELNNLASLQSAQPALNSANVGLTDTQGDAAQYSDVARSAFGVDGSGVMVGSISDSFDCTGAGGGAAADVANDDLPDGIVVLADLGGGCSDEGRAMMQLIHDVAPGSSQAFHTAFLGSADFANGIIELQQAGADVIVDDVIYFAEPMFQDGIIAQAAQTVADNGSAYFSSAGNNDVNSMEDSFRNSGIPGVFGAPMHDWDPGPGVDPFLSFLVQGFATTFIVLQWNEPYFSATGGAGSASDLDFFLWFNGTPLLGSFAANIGGDPVEIIGVSNSGPAGLVDLTVELWAGPEPTLMKGVTFGSDVRFGEGAQEYGIPTGSSYGHANAANIAGVGAAAYFNTGRFNEFCQPACLNGFSSRGGVPILFDQDDNPVNIVRQRPNFVGPDGGNTTFFGFDFEPDGFPNFFGTSASAPHAAAAAALMLETNPSLTPAEIYDILESTASDMNEPGYDFDTGYGFINVDLAVDAAATDPRNPKKRFVCHNGARNPGTISVNQAAVDAHLAHGDKYGPCE